jgi:hypothetical protein
VREHVQAVERVEHQALAREIEIDLFVELGGIIERRRGMTPGRVGLGLDDRADMERA